jgi:hypothetical protein
MSIYNYNIKRISIISILKTVPIILLIQGVFSTLLIFCLFLKESILVNIKTKLLTCIIFSISYSVIILCSTIIMIYVYNILSLKFNKQITITLDLLKK